jgi:hypothetical protein
MPLGPASLPGKLITGLYSLLDPFPRFGTKRLRRQNLIVLDVLMRGGTEKSDLPAITPTPFAKQQMNPQAEALAERQ